MMGLDKRVARIVRQCLDEGARVQIDGLGMFVPKARRGFRFVPEQRPRIFIAYASEELPAASRLYAALRSRGFEPWLDKKKLLPGQNWPRAIENAIESSDYFLPCFSRRSVRKRGMFQCELRFALECAERLPIDDTFVIPVRMDECQLPGRLASKMQYVNLFPDWGRGITRLVGAILKQEVQRRKNTPL
jgi:hypothetical protein